MFTFVFLVDHTPPVITNCDSGIDLREESVIETGATTNINPTKITPQTDGSYIYSWTFPTAEDPSNAVVYSQNRERGDYVFYPGRTDVSISFTDTYGNLAACLFTVIVRKSLRGALDIFDINKNVFSKYSFLLNISFLPFF